MKSKNLKIIFIAYLLSAAIWQFIFLTFPFSEIIREPEISFVIWLCMAILSWVACIGLAIISNHCEENALGEKWEYILKIVFTAIFYILVYFLLRSESMLLTFGICSLLATLGTITFFHRHVFRRIQESEPIKHFV